METSPGGSKEEPVKKKYSGKGAAGKKKTRERIKINFSSSGVKDASTFISTVVLRSAGKNALTSGFIGETSCQAEMEEKVLACIRSVIKMIAAFYWGLETESFR